MPANRIIAASPPPHRRVCGTIQEKRRQQLHRAGRIAKAVGKLSAPIGQAQGARTDDMGRRGQQEQTGKSQSGNIGNKDQTHARSPPPNMVMHLLGTRDALLQFTQQDIENRRQEKSEKGHAQHAGENRDAHGMAHFRPGAR